MNTAYFLIAILFIAAVVYFLYNGSGIVPDGSTVYKTTL